MEENENPVHIFGNYHILNCPNYNKAGRLLKQAGLRPAIGIEMASFISRLCPDGACSGLIGKVENLKKADVRLNHLFFWDFQKNRFTQKGPENEKGVWVVRDFEAKGLTEEIDVKKAESELTHESHGIKLSQNGEIAFVPERTYNTLNPDKLNGYITARAFLDAYRHLMFDSYRDREFSPIKGKIYTYRIQNRDIESLSGLFLCYGGFRDRLFILGNLGDTSKDFEMFAVGVPNKK